MLEKGKPCQAGETVSLRAWNEKLPSLARGKLQLGVPSVSNIMWSKLEISATRTLWKENDDRKTAQEKHVIQRKSEARTKSEARAYKPTAGSFPRNSRGEM
jgi:hypothetical protein